MAASPIKELYVSPNGDRWILGENQGGELVVCHDPNKRSGGRRLKLRWMYSFLMAGKDQNIRLSQRHWQTSKWPAKIPTIRYFRPKQSRNWITLLEKQAVARYWGSLTPEIQHDLFEAAVLSEGETIRQLLAVYLHGKPRVRLIWCKRGPCRNRKAWAVSVG
jgi:hypothetical protein